ncbi:glutamate receptor ionotropic, kainate 2-like isoform X1 [Stegodyphus dumicola]|uniref:glutamate receptor ionotropic, kainate 2-like isoform X1 n=1 Tax=Stegodyphus dumicola TaxID=202533 RepID=UPI0015B08B93|nr:glutamate receptor ionotropic, kainate 2-like isoform X1 [Stegodyphus dumicola]
MIEHPGWTFFLIVLALVLHVSALPAVVKVGALFTEDQKDSPSELAFKYSVHRINNDKTLLANTTLVYDIQHTPKDDSFHAAKKACQQVNSGVSAIFGPQNPLLGSHIQSLCDALDIPHIEARLDVESEEKEFSINLYPSPWLLGKAIRDLTKYLNWTKVAIIYEDDSALINLQELLKLPVPRNVQYVFRKTDQRGFRDVLRDIKGRGIYSIVVDTKPDNLPHLLKAILQVQMNDYKYYYHFTTLDVETYNLEDFKYNFVNMTAYRIIDTDNCNVKKVLKEMEKFQPVGHKLVNKTNVIKTEPALIYDSVYALAWGLNALQGGATLRPANVSCEEELPWTDGSSLFNYINSVEFRGLTGKIQFKEGRRSNLKLDLLKLRQNNMEKVGEWSTNNGLNITNHAAFHEFGTTNITLRVTTIESTPYVMLKSDRNLTGNERFEGFCIDLLRTISDLLGFNYDLYLVPDNKFGAENTTTGEWSGLVKEIIEKNADLAVAPMTINFARESVIDFTKPFMNLGIGILFKLPKNMPVRLFSFMSPLAVDIWLYVLAAYVLVSSTMFIVARFSPYEWQNPHPCVTESDVMENQFSLGNSFWFTIVTLMHQGCDLNPKATSTRIIGAIWWFFTLIMISSYTANLAAFLTVERMITPIESVEDLAEQSKISYGTLEGGSTMTFFRDSKIETYLKMWRYMENRPSVFVSSYEEGVQRVLEGNYAFLMESTMLDYMVQRDCNLTQVGGLLDSKGYGIATPMGSPWRDKISLAILELQEKGVIQMLYNKWWKSPGITCSRDDKNKDGKANALGVDNIGGVFVVLMCGLAVAILTAIAEFCWNSKKSAQSARVETQRRIHPWLSSAIPVCRDGGGASLRREVPSFPPTPSLASPMLQVHPRDNLCPSRDGSAPGEWHHADDRDEEIAHQLRLWRFLVSPENSNSSINNSPLH